MFGEQHSNTLHKCQVTMFGSLGTHHFSPSISPRHSMGHTKTPFCLQSCVKPLKYAVAVSELGTERVHQYVGKEPSGLRYDKLSLNEEGE